MWEIRDNRGVIYDGDEESMLTMWRNAEKDEEGFGLETYGDVVLVEVHARTR